MPLTWRAKTGPPWLIISRSWSCLLGEIGELTIRADHAGAEPAQGATGPTAEAAALGWLR